MKKMFTSQIRTSKSGKDLVSAEILKFIKKINGFLFFSPLLSSSFNTCIF